MMAAAAVAGEAHWYWKMGSVDDGREDGEACEAGEVVSFVCFGCDDPCHFCISRFQRSATVSAACCAQVVARGGLGVM
eukprot:2048243-Ditylum_brightwellii.AAC.1